MTALDKCRCGREGFANISECPRMRCMWKLEHETELVELKTAHQPAPPKALNGSPAALAALLQVAAAAAAPAASSAAREEPPVNFSSEVMAVELEVQWHDPQGNFASVDLVQDLATMTLPDGKMVKVMRGNGLKMEFWHEDGYRFRTNLEEVMINAAKRLHAITQGNTAPPWSPRATLQLAETQLAFILEDEKCDHDVGICWCQEYALQERIGKILSDDQFRPSPPAEFT